MNQIQDVLIAINNFMQTAPREFNCEIYNRGRVEGSSEMYLKVCYSFYMPQKNAELAADPLRIIGKPIEASWNWITHVQVQSKFLNVFHLPRIYILDRIRRFSTRRVHIIVDIMPNLDQSLSKKLILILLNHFVMVLKQLRRLILW